MAKISTAVTRFEDIANDANWVITGLIANAANRGVRLSVDAGHTTALLKSAATYDLANSYCLLEVFAEDTVDSDFYFKVRDNVNAKEAYIHLRDFHNNQPQIGNGVTYSNYHSSDRRFIKISHSGSTITMSISPDGRTWSTSGSVTTPVGMNLAAVNIEISLARVSANTFIEVGDLGVVKYSSAPATPYGGAAANNLGTGTNAWSTLSALTAAFGASGAEFAAGGDGLNDIYFGTESIKLAIGEEILATELNTNTNVYGYDGSYLSKYAGSFDLKGISSDQINTNGKTGVLIGLFQKSSKTTTTKIKSRYAQITQWSFNLPKKMKIDEGIIRASVGNRLIGGGSAAAYFGGMSLVYLQLLPVIQLEGKSGGSIRFGDSISKHAEEPGANKSYQYLVYDRAGKYIGEWTDVISKPSVKNALNQLPGELTITLARNIDSTVLEQADLAKYDYDGYILNSTGGKFTLNLGNSFSIGEGTDLETTNKVVVREYYGGFTGLEDEDGDEILLEDLSPVLLSLGAVEGKDFYRGYISKFGLQQSYNNTVTEVTLLHETDELNQKINMTEDTPALTSGALVADSYIGYGNVAVKPPLDYEGGVQAVGQTFQCPTTDKYGSITLFIAGWINTMHTLRLRTGGTIGAGTDVGVGTAVTSQAAPGGELVTFDFGEGVDLAGATNYNFSVSTDAEPQSNYQQYPGKVGLIAPSTYANGAAYIYSGLTPSWSAVTNNDLYFVLNKKAGLTRVPYQSVDIAELFRDAVDKSDVLNSDEIADLGYVISQESNMNTLKDLLDMGLKSLPSGVNYLIDPGTSELEIVGGDNPTFYLEQGIDAVDLKLEKSVEELANDIYFTGGQRKYIVNDAGPDYNYETLVGHESSEIGGVWSLHPAFEAHTLSVLGYDGRWFPAGGSGLIMAESVLEGVSDADVSIDVYIASTGAFEIGIVVSARRTLDYGLLVQVSNGNVQGYTRTPGTWTSVIGPVAVAPVLGSTNTLRVTHIGREFRIFWNGADCGSYSSSYSTAPNGDLYLGVRASLAASPTTGYHFSNFRAKDVSKVPPTVNSRKSDLESIAKWGRFVKAISDSRVTTYSTADLLAEQALAESKDPKYLGSGVSLRTLMKRRVKPGDVIKTRGLGDINDSLNLLVAGVTTQANIQDLELGTLAPKVSKRIEDIKRNLDLENNAANDGNTTGV